MAHDAIVRWENEGGSVLRASGTRRRRDRPRSDEPRADESPRALKASEAGNQLVSSARRVTRRNSPG